MRIANSSLQSSSTSMATSFNLDGFFLGHIANYSIQLVFTGTPNGSFKLQCSNDRGKEDKGNGGWSAVGVTNWTDISGSDQSVTAAGDIVWDVQDCGYRWVRVVWIAASSGTTPVLTSAICNAKGI